MDHPQGEDQHGANQPAQGAPRQEFRREINPAEHVYAMDTHIKADHQTIVMVMTAIYMIPIALILWHAIRGTYSGSQATTQTQVQPTAQSKFSY